VLRLFLAEELHDFTVIRKTPYFGLGKYEAAPIFHIENASAGTNEFRLDSQCLLQFLRQTGGFGFVVSGTAISNFADIGHFFPSRDEPMFGVEPIIASLPNDYNPL
jgi:hypothetical protein